MLLFGYKKLHLREHGHPVQAAKVSKLKRPTFDEVWIFFPQPTVFTGDTGCVKHCNIIKTTTRYITFTDFLLLEV